MASLNTILHDIANVLPFRSESDLRAFQADIDEVTLSPVSDGVPEPSDADVVEDQDVKPPAKSSAAAKK